MFLQVSMLQNVAVGHVLDVQFKANLVIQGQLHGGSRRLDRGLQDAQKLQNAQGSTSNVAFMNQQPVVRLRCGWWPVIRVNSVQLDFKTLMQMYVERAARALNKETLKDAFVATYARLQGVRP